MELIRTRIPMRITSQRQAMNSPLQSFQNGMTGNQGNWNRPFPGRSVGQAAIDAQQNPDAAFDASPSRGNFGPSGIDRVGYQNAQPWGPPNGMPPQWNGNNPGTRLRIHQLRFPIKVSNH